MNTQVMNSNPATIKAYFEKVRQLAKDGDQFPVNLDDVWPLVYSEKAVAVRALKKNFFEGEDYTSFDILVKREVGGTSTISYRLSASCLEYFIARKVRGVFEVYRQVFHKVAGQIEKPRELSRKELALLVIQQEEEKEQLAKRLEQQAPKVQYAEQVLDTADCFVTTVLANELGYSAVTFNKKLKEMGIQWKVDGVWVLTSRYLNKGYAQMRTHTFNDPTTGLIRATQYMVWTQRGRAFLWWQFKKQQHPEMVALPAGAN